MNSTIEPTSPETFHLGEDECKTTRCPGLFVDGETLAVTRCDTCERFESDEDAAECVNVLLDMLATMLHGPVVEGHAIAGASGMSVADTLDVMEKLLGVRIS